MLALALQASYQPENLSISPQAPNCDTDELSNPVAEPHSSSDWSTPRDPWVLRGDSCAL